MRFKALLMSLGVTLTFATASVANAAEVMATGYVQSIKVVPGSGISVTLDDGACPLRGVGGSTQVAPVFWIEADSANQLPLLLASMMSSRKVSLRATVVTGLLAQWCSVTEIASVRPFS